LDPTLSVDKVDALLRHANTLRDHAGAGLAASRALIKLLRHVRQQIRPPRVRGRFRSRLNSKSLAVSIFAQGMTAADVADRTGLAIERVGNLMAGARPSDHEREVLHKILPTWEVES
jgi:hypothetical protein